MADDNASTSGDEEQFYVLKDEAGSLYMLSSTNLAQHRVPDDVAESLQESLADEVSGFVMDGLGSFTIVGRGPLAPRLAGHDLPPINTWVDTM